LKVGEQRLLGMHATEQDFAAARALTARKKLEILSGLILQAWELKEAWLRVRNPDQPEDEIRRRARRLVSGSPS